MSDRFTLRRVPEALARRYVAEELWTDETLGSLLDARLREHARLEVRIWSTTRPVRSTFGETRALALRLAAGLHAHGIGPGDMVAFQLPNWIEAAATFWGTALVGATVVPVVHFYGPKELGFVLRQSGARALVTAERFGPRDYLDGLAAIRPDLPDLELVVVVGDPGRAPHAVAFTDLLDRAPLGGPVEVSPDAPALVAYTSGTTADPKGVVHSHRTLLAELRQAGAMGSPESRPMLMGAPVGHAIGMLGGLLGPAARGRAIHLIDVWDPPVVLDALVDADLVFGGGATYFFTSLLDAPNFRREHVDHLRYTGLGGAPVPAAVSERADALGVSIVRSYGSTEHPSVTGAGHDEPHDARVSTDGHALPGVELRLIADGHDVAPGTPGEIVTRGPELFVGYTDPALTAAAVDADGWYSTGDVGVLDAAGYLTITDRRSDIVIRGGENVSAAEIEELLLQMPGVTEVAVVAAPDARLGEHACAFVRVARGMPAPDLVAVRAHLDAAGLARQKWPEELRVVDDFPRTPSSKVKKHELRARLRAEAT